MTIKPSRSPLAIRSIVLAVAAATASTAPPARAADNGASLFDMTLEALLNLEVTSVSAKSERLVETTSAVYVITQDDIVRYGIRSVPEALRLAPGLSVLQIDANKWAVGSRGATGRFSNKLLVLMDGRILYTPAFSGVFWDVQDTNLDDIVRIEVIRGPGATIWGANAVNGVINIITRAADREDDRSVTTRIEDDGTYLAAASFSGGFADQADYRVFVKHQDADDSRGALGAPVADGWRQSRAGLRVDWTPTQKDSLAFTTEFYEGDIGLTEQLVTPVAPYSATRDLNTEVSGGFVVGRWAHETSSTLKSSAQVTLDHTNRASLQYGETRDTYQLDFGQQRTLSRHDVVYGASYRSNSYEIGTSARFSVPDTTPSDRSISVFAQDEFAVVPEKLRLTWGTKLEHNDLSDRSLDVMPTVRLLWQPTGDTAIWAAVTRALRTPSYGDRAARVLDISPVTPPGAPNNPFPLPMHVSATGTAGFVSESVVSREVGFRGRLSAKASYDIALYQSSYDDVRANLPVDVVCNPSGVSALTNPQCLFTSTGVTTEVLFVNAAAGDAKGLELAVDWDVSDNWRVRTSYSYTDEQLTAPAPIIVAPRYTPKNQASVRSEWSINSALRLASWLRYVDEIEPLSIESYWQAYFQLEWEPNDHWRLATGGRNLLGSQLEFVSELSDMVPVEAERLYYVTAQWRF
jgi:iron complex outermembrane receptor protein